VYICVTHWIYEGSRTTVSSAYIHAQTSIYTRKLHILDIYNFIYTHKLHILRDLMLSRTWYRLVHPMCVVATTNVCCCNDRCVLLQQPMCVVATTDVSCCNDRSSTAYNMRTCIFIYMYVYIHPLPSNSHELDIITNLVSPRTCPCEHCVYMCVYIYICT